MPFVAARSRVPAGAGYGGGFTASLPLAMTPSALGRLHALLLPLLFALLTLGQPARAAAPLPGPLVDVATLDSRLASGEWLVIDTSPPSAYAAGHIPGSRHLNVWLWGGRVQSAEAMRDRLQALGLRAGQPVVVLDEGGGMTATRLAYDLLLHGLPPAQLAILDGGLAKWKALGKPLSTTPPPPAARGDWTPGPLREELRSSLPAVLAASGQPQRHALVEALEPEYYFGAARFFDRGGHLPNAILWSSSAFYNADKTFKSPDEIRRVARHLGLRDDQPLTTYCGGGVAASVPFYALHRLAGRPQVALYSESQREYLMDERGLPMWTYAQPQLERRSTWLAGWNQPMLRAFGHATISVIDLRPKAQHDQGHLPFALHLPAELWRRHLDRPEALAPQLGAAGVDPAQEAVLVSDRGLTPDAALALLMLERLGQRRASVFTDTVDDWALAGHPLAKEPTVVGRPSDPRQLAVPPARYEARPWSAAMAADAVRVHAGAPAPAGAIALPWRDLIDPAGRPRPAGELWALLNKAGVPRDRPIVCTGDDPGEAAVVCVVLKMMGYAGTSLGYFAAKQ